MQKIPLRRVAPGYYFSLDGKYTVLRFAGRWYWREVQDLRPSPLFPTKAEAVDSLAAFLDGTEGDPR